MTSSTPVLTPLSRLLPLSMTALLPQCPIMPWQAERIRNPVPLEQLRDFLATDVEQQTAPEEQSTLVQAVAREMDVQQVADHIQQKSWHKMEVEKRRRTMAQPSWRTAMETQPCNPFSSQPSMPASRPQPTSLPGMPPLATLHETPADAEEVPPMFQESSSSDSESKAWKTWCDLQESNC